ncbi:MAG: hypothetical protein ACLFUB_07235 [Cyclobacteriaceae bacterium]
MTLEQFNRLPFFQRHSLALNNGEVILKQENPNHTIRVYCIENFFVEIWKNKLSHMPDSLLAFRSTELLDKYAGQINLNDLY